MIRPRGDVEEIGARGYHCTGWRCTTLDRAVRLGLEVARPLLPCACPGLQSFFTPPPSLET